MDGNKNENNSRKNLVTWSARQYPMSPISFLDVSCLVSFVVDVSYSVSFVLRGDDRYLGRSEGLIRVFRDGRAPEASWEGLGDR